MSLQQQQSNFPLFCLNSDRRIVSNRHAMSHPDFSRNSTLTDPVGVSLSAVPAAVRLILNLIISETAHLVIIDHPNSLHKCVANGGAYKLEPVFFKLFAHRF